MKTSKRTISLVLILTLALSIISGCSGGGTASSQAPSAGTNTTSPGGEDEKITLSVSVGNYSQTSIHAQGTQKLVELLEEYSDGSITADIYYDNSLGDLSTQVEAISDGALDMLMAGNSYYSAYVPLLQTFELPFLFSSLEEARHVMDGEAGTTISNMFDGTGIKILRYWEVGMRQLTNNKKAIHSIEDLQGIRIRVLPVEIQVAAWETFGAVVLAIDGAELYSSLQTGIVDGQENPLEGIYANKIFEVQKHITITNHVYTPAAYAISDKTWNKLSASQQEVIQKAMDDATDYFRDLSSNAEKTALQALKDEGCEIVEDPDLSGFNALAPDIYAIFRKSQSDADSILALIDNDKASFAG